MKSAIYSSGVSLRLLPTPQLARHPYLRHYYHVSVRSLSVSVYADTSAELVMTTFQPLSPSGSGRIFARDRYCAYIVRPWVTTRQRVMAPSAVL
jgi:hypothetical protein